MASVDVKKILVLGSGMVAPPCIEYLSRNPNNRITLASRNLATAEKLALKFPNTRAIALDIPSSPDLDADIASADIVISLLPFTHHAAVVHSALKSHTHVVTTSYISDSLRALHPQCQAAGITVLNEVGVDPGIDHLYAIKKIASVHAQGGKVREFHSYCGGLPAPECANNPLGFKFSWSPRGALLSQVNSARYLSNGVVQCIPAAELMSSAAPYYVQDGYKFVAYANRDSVPFREFYDIPEARTVVRGSLRYQGNPAFVQALGELGWLDAGRKEWLREGMSWGEIMMRLVGADGSAEVDLIPKIKLLVQDADVERIVSGLRWMGIFSSNKATVTAGNLLDTLCTHLSTLMSYAPGERDLVMLQHKFVVEWADGSMEASTSTLELFGDPEGYSAMARSVGVTCRIATQLVLDGHAALQKLGVWAPYEVDACEAIREMLEREGVRMVERVV